MSLVLEDLVDRGNKGACVGGVKKKEKERERNRDITHQSLLRRGIKESSFKKGAFKRKRGSFLLNSAKMKKG